MNTFENRAKAHDRRIRRLEAILFRITSNGDLNLTNVVGVLPPVAGGTSGTVDVIRNFINNAGVSLNEGDVVILDSAGGRAITRTTAVADQTVLGVVHGTAAPYANGAETPVLLLGYHAAVHCTGAVTAEHYLETSATAAYAQDAGTGAIAGVFAIATTSKGAGLGTVEAFIFGAALSVSVAHAILSATHSDTTAAAVQRGDLMTGQGASPTWSRLGKPSPAAGIRDVVKFDNGDNEAAWVDAVDNTNPVTQAYSDSPAPGTSLIFARRDHKHGMPASPSAASSTKVITLVIDGGGQPITAGIKADVSIPYAGTIISWRILADLAGSIVIDVWKDVYASFPPTILDTIAGSEKPTLSGVSSNEDTNLTTWLTGITAGDVIRFNVEATPATVTRIVLELVVSV